MPFHFRSEVLRHGDLVVRVPADFDPQAEHLGRRARGEVTAVDAAAGTLSLRTPAGEELTFATDAGTRYLGSIASQPASKRFSSR